MKRKNIVIRFGRPGEPVIKIKVLEKSTVNEVIKDFLHIEHSSLYIFINGKKKSLNTILKNNDLLVLFPTTHNEVTVKRNGRAWRIHKNDKDELFPSDFHAHNIETGEKLDLYTGYLYNPVTKKMICALNKKEWLAILLVLKNCSDNNVSLKSNAVLILQK